MPFSVSISYNFKSLFVGFNLRNLKPFPKHNSELYIWAPEGNPTFYNEAKEIRLFRDPDFWVDYFNENDPEV